ncbi:hypothetical protein EAH79_06175 [Sphingomonas koreensis]|nr:hypothetical protein EAH79_06175 [Sphingomonas koreensis]
MIAGLLFANDDADDRPEMLAATLPFAGATLIEFQARLLIAAGAAQIIVAVTRTTPELIGAINRIARRGVPVDVARTAGEALEKTHPLATIVMLADGLITTESIVEQMATGEGDALLVANEEGALPGFERVGAGTLWAGIARIGPRRLADAARLPDEYDLQSTLLRVVAQGDAARVSLAGGDLRGGHGIERDSRRLAARGRSALGARLARGKAWFDRWLLAPLARLVLPPLLDRSIPSAWLSASGAVLGLGGLAMLFLRWPRTGLALAVAAVLVLGLARALCWLQNEERHARWLDKGAVALAGAATLLLGWTLSRDSGTATGLFAAVTLVIVVALAERAASDRIRAPWWGTPPAFLLVLAVITIAGEPLAGLIAAAAYAAAGLGSAIERLRDKP